MQWAQIYAEVDELELIMSAAVEDLHMLQQLEERLDLTPDWAVDAYMRTEAIEDRERSVLTAFVLRMLGLKMCADTKVCPSLV